MAEEAVVQMDRKAVETVMDRWTNDPSFKKRLHEDPRAAFEECGVKLTEAQLAKLISRGQVDLSLSAEQLVERLQKGLPVQ